MGLLSVSLHTGMSFFSFNFYGIREVSVSVSRLVDVAVVRNHVQPMLGCTCATHVGLHMFTNLSTSTKYTRSPNIRTVLNISVSVLTCVCCVATNLGGQLRLPSAVSCAPPASNSVSSVTMCLSTSIQTGVLLSVLPQNTTAHTALELQHS